MILFSIYIHASGGKTSDLEGGDALLAAKDGEEVVSEGISDVLRPVGVRTLTGDVGLDGETKDGNHGETAVLDLLNLELGEHLGVISKTKGVEGASGVEVIETSEDGGLELPDTRGVTRRALTRSTVLLSGAHESNLDGNDDNKGEGVVDHTPGDSEPVKGSAVEHLGTGLEPDTTVDRGTVGLESLGDDDTSSGKHGPASVDELVDTVLADLLGVLTKTERVVTVVTSKLTGEVGGDIGALKEAGRKEELAVSTVPLVEVGVTGSGSEPATLDGTLGDGARGRGLLGGGGLLRAGGGSSLLRIVRIMEEAKEVLVRGAMMTPRSIPPTTTKGVGVLVPFPCRRDPHGEVGN